MCFFTYAGYIYIERKKERMVAAMTINFEPYIHSIQQPDFNTVRPALRTSAVSPILNNTYRDETDINLYEAVDPVFEGQPGSLLDIHV